MNKGMAQIALQNFPVWYQPEAPLGSAVHYVATLSPLFNWVGIYILKGKTLELGPYLGAPPTHRRIPVGKGICGTAVSQNQDQNVGTRSELVVLIRDKKGKILGQIDIDSEVLDAFGKEEESAVRRIASELGTLWPE